MSNAKTLEFQDAGEYRTDIKGWICKICNRYWGTDERADYYARSCCADHPCADCGGMIKPRSYCSPCQQRRTRENWEGYKRVEWKGEPLGLIDSEEMFWGEDELAAYLEEHSLAPEDAMLVFMEEEPKPEFEIEDAIRDYLGEDSYDGDPSEIEKQVNDWIKANVGQMWRWTQKVPSPESLRRVLEPAPSTPHGEEGE